MRISYFYSLLEIVEKNEHLIFNSKISSTNSIQLVLFEFSFLFISFSSHLDVLDSAAHKAVLLKRIPADVKDLQDRGGVRTNMQQHRDTHTHKGEGLPRTLSECPVAEARIFPLLHSQMHTVFLASRPTDASRCRDRSVFRRLGENCGKL